MGYLMCKKCGNKHFLIDVIHSDIGIDDSYEFLCAKCGEYYPIYDGDNITGSEDHLVSEIARSWYDNGEMVCLEQWVEDGMDAYVISLYSGEDLVYDHDFGSLDKANECYDKCIKIFEAPNGDISKVILLFNEC